MTEVTSNQPTGVQLEALRRYAREEGRNWKSKLLDDWTNGRTVGPLQELRNQFGPAWLQKHGTKAISAPQSYKLLADDIVVWTGNRKPTQADIDDAAGRANERGWNGCDLDLCLNDRWLDFVKPSESVLS